MKRTTTDTAKFDNQKSTTRTIRSKGKSVSQNLNMKSKNELSGSTNTVRVIDSPFSVSPRIKRRGYINGYITAIKAVAEIKRNEIEDVFENTRRIVEAKINAK